MCGPGLVASSGTCMAESWAGGCLSAELTMSLRGEGLMCGRIFSYRCPTDLFRTLQLSSTCYKFRTLIYLRVH